MQYISSYSWYPEATAHCSDSLLLQQMHCKKIPLLLACVSSGDYLTGRLLDWFYQTGRKLCGRGKEKNVRRMRDSLEKVLRQSLAESEGREFMEHRETDFAGILCVGHYFVLFYQGKQRICLLNTRFLRSHMKVLTGMSGGEEQNSFRIEQGVMQSGIGILLALEPFYQKLSGEALQECLEAAAFSSSEQLGRHLRELGGNAVMIVTT